MYIYIFVLWMAYDHEGATYKQNCLRKFTRPEFVICIDK